MINIEKLLANFFDKKNISRSHLLTYSKDHLQRLITANTNHQYDDIIAFLTPLVTNFELEIGNEDTSINLRKGQTKSVEQLTIDFGNTLSDLEGGISKILGGRKSIGYLEFFPNGLTEYNRPGREDMDLFTNRISKAATKYATLLGLDITAELKALKTDFNTARTSQVTTIAEVSVNRTAISSNQLALELGLSNSIHSIGLLFPGNYTGCIGLFNENLLYPVTHHHHQLIVGLLAAQGTEMLINKTFTDTYTIEIKNTGTNASYWIWLGATATDTDNTMAIEVKPGKTATIKPSDIGDLKKTFLMIKNDSTVNATSYEVTLIG